MFVIEHVPNNVQHYVDNYLDTKYDLYFQNFLNQDFLNTINFGFLYSVPFTSIQVYVLNLPEWDFFVILYRIKDYDQAQYLINLFDPNYLILIHKDVVKVVYDYLFKNLIQVYIFHLIVLVYIEVNIITSDFDVLYVIFNNVFINFFNPDLFHYNIINVYFYFTPYTFKYDLQLYVVNFMDYYRYVIKVYER